MKKIKKILFPQRGKENPLVRLFVVITYVGLILGSILIIYQSFEYIRIQNLLTAEDVDWQLSATLLDSSITQSTVQAFSNSGIHNPKRDLSEFSNGYEYKNELIYNEIPKLASSVNGQDAENIKRVGSILENNIKKYQEGRWENFNPFTIVDDILLEIIFIVLPIFIFFRAVVYKIVLYVIFGKNKA